MISSNGGLTRWGSLRAGDQEDSRIIVTIRHLTSNMQLSNARYHTSLVMVSNNNILDW